MKIAIMQPYLFPYIGYFQLIKAVDKFIVYDDVNFIKQGWINRNSILVQNKSYLFTLPLNNQSSFSKINEVKISDKFYESWKMKFLRTIEQSYKKAPFFSDSLMLIKEILNGTEENLTISSYNTSCLKIMCTYLDINTEIVDSSSIYSNSDLNGQNRILNICLREEALQYINPIGGLELYDGEAFKNIGVELNFLKTDSIIYNQFGKEFVPFLSIIDVLMFNSPQEINVMLNNYKLI